MMSGRFLTDEPCRVVRCLIKSEVETDKQLKRIFARLNRFLLENTFEISFSNMSVGKFSRKKIRKMISERIFLNARVWLRFAQPRSVRH